MLGKEFWGLACKVGATWGAPAVVQVQEDGGLAPPGCRGGKWTAAL